MTDRERHHKACDECRIRKLKCPGEYPSCSRCMRDDVPCVYSLQKTMGRPRKRRRSDALRAAHQRAASSDGGYISIPMDVDGHHLAEESSTSQWGEDDAFIRDTSRLLDMNILGSADSGYDVPSFESARSAIFKKEQACKQSANGGCHPIQPPANGSRPRSNGYDAGLDTLFDPNIQSLDFSSLLGSDMSPTQPAHQPPPPPQPQPIPTPSRSGCSGSQYPPSTLYHTPPSVLPGLIDHTKIPLEVGTAVTPKDFTAFGMQSDLASGLNCDCLIHFFSAIMTLKKMIYNPVHLSPPTPFATPPPPISLDAITAISATAIDVTKTSLKCASCNMCFTTLMNVGQLLGLLLRGYSQFLRTSGGSAMPLDAAKQVVRREMDQILDILGQVEIRSLARHGMVLGDETQITKDMVGRGVIERIATGSWIGDRNPLCLKIVGMVRGLADGLLCGVGVGECVGEQCPNGAIGLNTMS
ncbi:hypothetical protein DRE_00066 [Drechslerella stenobrocha 248]|uniref:Zn(2)-C6 fungal-type domain-containing protein n=1 Tax=Drechslerella stenobrocha 248 TaxID=1043628 RepID=W7HX49_9PEZI|nr:hypothetical protein DRE_00066 [Drechslerella stenobrocha 248]